MPSIGATIDGNAAQSTLAERQLAADVVAKGNKGRRGRSRKRHRAGAMASGQAAERASSQPPARASRPSGGGAGRTQRAGGHARRTGANREPRNPGGILGSSLALGERPPAPWHPLPLSELLILIGAVGAIIGVERGISRGAAPLFAGLAAVIIGTVEVTLREHLSGYRSHALILSLLPIIALDTALAFGLAAIVTPLPVSLKVALIVLDLPVFAFLYKLLRSRFQDARRERAFAAGR